MVTTDKTLQDMYGTESVLDKVWSKGILVQIQGGVWSMQAKLQATDINLVSDDLPEFVTLGHKKLLPNGVKNQFLNTIGRARSGAERYGFPFFITNSYFIPFSNFEKFKDIVDSERIKFDLQVDNFMRRYEEVREDYLEKLPDHRAKLEEHYPDPEMVRSKFRFDAVYYAATVSPFSGSPQDIEEMYVGWAVDSMNSLREEAREVATAITNVLDKGNVDGRSMRKVQGLIDRLDTMDMLEDEELKNSAQNLARYPTRASADRLKKVAKEVNPTYVRRVLLD
tara:strand:+ start:1728 stop:2570 length:843 start_codon:yes stop_codon:yes gene_type:complete